MKQTEGTGGGHYRVLLLGGFFVRDSVTGTPGDKFRTQRSAWLLARLACQPGSFHSRDILAEWLWPETPSETQRSRLRYELTLLRRVLDKDAVLTGGNDKIALSGTQVTSDVADFQRAIQEQRWQDATQLYTGDFCPGVYDDWVLTKRSELSTLAYGAFQRSLAQAITCGDLVIAHHIHRAMAAHFAGDQLPPAPPPLPDRVEATAPMPAPAAPVETVPAPAAPPPPRTDRLPTADVPASIHGTIARLKSARPLFRFTAVIIPITLITSLAVSVVTSHFFPRWNFTEDFSTKTPLFHQWQLGTRNPRTGVLVPMHLAEQRVSGFENEPYHWTGGYAHGDVLKNVRAPISPGVYSAAWHVGKTYFHPAHRKFFPTCLRWTAPHAASFQIAAQFDGVSLHARNGTTVDLLLLHNNRFVWNGEVRGTVVARVPNNKKPSAIYDGLLELRQGDTLDFLVSDAGDYEADVTAVAIHITDPRLEARRTQCHRLLAVFVLFVGVCAWFRAKPRRPSEQ